ncbi:hypothetical protein ACFQZT_05165 [Paenibacillus sp. GCM10027628]|uniref:hypothetical protein n=1 Tax=Paenibacillus sp. GCM10027628 TaxID=3273413 RepID=UPI003644D850
MKPKKLRGLDDQLVTNPNHLSGEVFEEEYIIQESDFSEERLNQLLYWVLSEGKQV